LPHDGQNPTAGIRHLRVAHTPSATPSP
jgi:hypothetical protein